MFGEDQASANVQYPIFGPMESISLPVARKRGLMDESIDQGMIGAPVLLMLVDDCQVHVGVVDSLRNKAVALQVYHMPSEEDSDHISPGKHIESILRSDSLIVPWKDHPVHVGFFSAMHSIVPDPLFHKDSVNDILALTGASPEDSMNNMSELVPSIHAQFLYALPLNVQRVLEQRFGTIRFHSASAPFIECRLRENKFKQSPLVSVHVRPRYLDIMVSEGNELLFFNSFRYRTAEDFTYYILFVLEQLGLNPDTQAVEIFGEIEKSSSHWMLARKYVREIHAGNRCSGLEYSYGFDSIPSHLDYALFSLFMCGS